MHQPMILVVEDNPTLQKMVSLMAKRRGVETVVVGSAGEAVQEVQAGPERFFLILMDLSLPDASGLECTARLRPILRTHVPIVAMTGHAMPGDREACLDAGMDDYLCKPFTFDEFASLLTKWMSVEHFPMLPAHEQPQRERELPPGA
jgi:CheY-like chemotaxis protein